MIFSVIKRLIHLLSAVAREMADANAAHKQAEGARRHLQDLVSDKSQVRINVVLDLRKTKKFKLFIYF